MRLLLFFTCFCLPALVLAQESDPLLVKKKVAVRDSIQLDTLSINPYNFRVWDSEEKEIPKNAYRIDYAKAMLFPGDSLLQTTDSLRVHYRLYPAFLTRKYFQYDPSRIVNLQNRDRLYQLNQNRSSGDFKPFSGLNTTGSISRGITAGTNQNSVLDSKLDLQITGKISNDVSLRASIQDSDIPIGQNGYSQNLNEFDQVFIELFGNNWNIRGGDVDLEQNHSYFGNYHKKVQGLAVGFTLDGDESTTDFYAAGALVRGVFTRNQFDAQEGNQGPYKLRGPNGELFALVVSGSETVYVNGIRLKRGEDNDYVIDYNAGEIRFNSTYPITGEMRITVEFQYADRNYSRVVATAGVTHKAEKWNIGGFLYTENDLRNQPLQQDLTDEQKFILADAGDNPDLMVAPSAIPDEFSENRILYRKDTINGVEVYVHSTNPTDELFRVKFSLVGEGKGDYVISSQTAIAKIYEYVPPVNGIPQGSYAPITRLFAPTKLQMAVVNGGFHPSEKTQAKFELAVSSYDQNLFSKLDNDDNEGLAGHLDLKQNLFTAKDSTQVNAFAKIDYVHRNFQSVQPLYNVEFNRDWNLENPQGNQTLIDAGVEYLQARHGFARYSFQHLEYSDSFKGSRQVVDAHLKFGNLRTDLNGSYLNSDGSHFSSDFFRINTQAVYSYKPFWSGVRFESENNQQTDKVLNELTALSQKFYSYEVFTGVGDSTVVYAEIGYRRRASDSLRNTQLERVGVSDNYYLKSQLINSENSNLAVFLNYRRIKNRAENKVEKNLNSRLRYQQFLFDRVLHWNTTYETSGGTLPQQEYTYIEVEPGKGEYTWIDYNGDGIQDLDEFELASFQDEAKYIRVLLPNQIFVKIRQTKLSQIVNLNFQQLASQSSNHWLTRFYNQTSFLVDRRVETDGNKYHLNPFHSDGEELAVNLNFRNTLFFNRGKQNYTTSYTYISSQAKNLFSTGLQENKLQSHQLDFNHKVGKSWLFSYKNEINESVNTSETFQNRDYQIDGLKIHPKISYFLNQNTRFDFYYQYYQRQNKIGEEEKLNQQKLGTSFNFSNARKYSISGEFNYILNDFTGDTFSPVAYEMLQGLQPEKNFTWQLLFQKKITDYLDLNFAYNGRKSPTSPVIHTGSVQLKAYF